MARKSCVGCSGVLDDTTIAPAVCPTAQTLVSVPSTVAATGCLNDVDNFRRLPVFTKQHFVPRTGRGKFDVTYNPNNGNLDITVKLNMATTAKSFWSSEGFTSDELLGMRNDFSQSVPPFWDGKWRFRCRKGGFGTLPNVTPRFHVVFDSPVGSHFRLIIELENPDIAIHNPLPEMRSCRGFVSINQVVSNDPTVQDRIELHDFHTRDFQHSLMPGILAKHERQRLENAVARIGTAATEGQNEWIFMAFDTLGASQRLALQTFARTGLERVSGAHKVPIKLKGIRGASEEDGKGRERADAVANVLTTARFDNPVEYEASAVGDPTGVKVMINTTYENNLPALTYNVAAHEFGHMLGLPDEYENPMAGGTADNNAKAQVKTRFLALVNDVGLLPPTFPSHTMSMMSDGMTIQAFHAVTIWDALCFLTRGLVAPADWEIMMV